MDTNEWWINEDADRKVIEGIIALGKAMILAETVEKPQVKCMIMKFRPSKH